MENKYQEALNKVLMDNPKILLTTSDIHSSILVLKKLVDKETPKKFEITDRDLIFHSTPHPTEYYLTIKCYCGQKFGCRGYQHWKVIDKHNVAKDYFEYEYSYCPYCGQKLDWSEENE